MKKKVLRILAAAAAFLIIAGIMFVAVGVIENPVSKMIVRKSAENYISSRFPDSDLVVDSVEFDSTETAYTVNINSVSSIDTHFVAYFSSFGIFQSDEHERVTDGTNTYFRICDEYAEMVDSALKPLDDEHFGFLAILERYADIKDDREYKFGIKPEELELDKKYDIKQLAKEYGEIDLDCRIENLSFENAAKTLLTVKNLLDKADIPAHLVCFKISDSSNENQYIAANDFPFNEIYEDGLEERIKNAHDDLITFEARREAGL